MGEKRQVDIVDSRADDKVAYKLIHQSNQILKSQSTLIVWMNGGWILRMHDSR